MIPKAIRDELGIVPGDEIDFSLEDDGLRLEAVREKASLRGSLAGHGLVSMLEADRSKERDR